MDTANLLTGYPALAALLTTDPQRARALLGTIELTLLAESDTRIRQAVQWAKALGLRDEDLLLEIPEIPITLLQPRGALNLLTLVPFHLGNVQLARAAGLRYDEHGHTDRTLAPVEGTRYDFSRLGWCWVLAHDGSPNLGREPSDCLTECMTGPHYAGVDKVGVAIHHIHGARKHVMYLLASVYAGNRDRCAYVYPFDIPELDVNDRACIAGPAYGPVVFVFE